MKFSTVAMNWLQNEQDYIKPSTYARYEIAIINHLIPEFGLLEMDNICGEVLQGAVNRWRESGRLDGRGGLSYRSVRDLVALYKQITNSYHQLAGCPAPSCKIRMATVPVKALNVYSSTEYKRLLTYLKNSPDRISLAVMLALLLGMRIGEVCGLKWKNVDLTHRTLKVAETVQRIYRKPVEGVNNSSSSNNNNNSGSSNKSCNKSFISTGTPKTISSCRELPCPEPIIEKLRYFGSIDKKQDNYTEFYVVTGSSRPTEPRALRARYKTLISHSGLRYISFHSLRHTFATLMIGRGAGEKTTSAILGHASVQITLDFYVHPQLEDKRRAINRCLM